MKMKKALGGHLGSLRSLAAAFSFFTAFLPATFFFTEFLHQHPTRSDPKTSNQNPNPTPHTPPQNNKKNKYQLGFDFSPFMVENYTVRVFTLFPREREREGRIGMKYQWLGSSGFGWKDVKNTSVMKYKINKIYFVFYILI